MSADSLEMLKLMAAMSLLGNPDATPVEVLVHIIQTGYGLGQEVFNYSVDFVTHKDEALKVIEELCKSRAS